MADNFDPKQHIGQTVTVRGTAANARAGAIVQLPDRTPIYIKGLRSWDSAHAGKQVEVTGQMVERPARVRPNPAGEQVHGLVDATYMIEDGAWTIVG